MPTSTGPRPRCWACRCSNVFDTLNVYLGSSYVNDFNYLGRTYRVQVQADGQFRREVRDIANLKTRNARGDMVPLGSVATFRDLTGPYRVPHNNLYPAAEVQGATLPGFSTGQAIAAMERLAAEVLPDGFAFEWTELAYQEKLAGNTAIYVFIASVVFVFLFLAAQYESWLLPLAVILIVPMCLLAAITRRPVPRAGQQHPGPDRPDRAGRPRRQERDPDRRVREAARGGGRGAAPGRESTPPAPACARS